MHLELSKNVQVRYHLENTSNYLHKAIYSDNTGNLILKEVISDLEHDELVLIHENVVKIHDLIIVI